MITIRVFPSKNKKKVVFTDKSGKEKAMFFRMDATFPEIKTEVEKCLIA